MHRNRAKYFIEVIIHALFWLGVYYALQAVMVTSYNIQINHTTGGQARFDGQIRFGYSGIVLVSLMLLFYSNVFWLFKKIIAYKSAWQRVSVVTGWMTLLFAANYEVIRLLIRPIGPVVFSATTGGRAPIFPVPKLPAELWWQLQPVIAVVFLSVLAFAVAYFFIREWVRNEMRRSQVEAHQLSTEIKFLRSQVNPHFLFNTLNNLFSMAQRNEDEDLANGISKLSGIMRYMLHESNTDLVSLQKEIDYLNDCIALHKLRYADSEASVCFNHPPPAAVSGVSIAPMLLVPFLENAFKHGVSIGHRSDIGVSITIDANRLIFACENTDNSGVKKPEAENTGIGLQNVKRRLELLYPGKHALRAGPENGKYCVNLQIELA